MPDMSLLVAHQGGWDEILLVVVPIVAIVGLLVVARRRIGAASVDKAEVTPVELTEAETTTPGKVDRDD